MKRESILGNNSNGITHLVEVWFYMNGPSKLAAPISCKQFFGLKFSFELTKCTFVCSNQLN
jgi:hypothetical protein